MEVKKVTRLVPDPSVLKFLERASTVVAEMPAWQRANLDASRRSTNSAPRPIAAPLSEEVNPAK